MLCTSTSSSNYKEIVYIHPFQLEDPRVVGGRVQKIHDFQSKGEIVDPTRAHPNK